MAIALPLPSRGAPGLSGAAAPVRPRLTAVPEPPRRRRRPRAVGVAAYGAGATAGFALAALASVPGGDAIVSGQLQLAGVSATVTALAALRSRAVSRRRSADRPTGRPAPR